MVHIRRLREKLEEDPSHPRFLLTVRGWATGSNGGYTMKLSSWMKGAMLVTVSALLIFVIMMLGGLAFTWNISEGGTEWNAPHPDHIRFAGF